MEIKEMTIDELQARKAAIATEVDAEGADLDALETEARSINAELESRKEAESKKTEIRAQVASGAGNVIKSFEEREESKRMTLEEVRASHEYIEAYKKYIISDDATECRSIITENAPETVTGSGPVPVPVIVDQFIRTAWENDPIMSRVRRTFVRGNLKVTFEKDADPAVVHEEGTEHPNEETLELGTVLMVPKNIKKWITITDESLAMGGEEFLRYIYDEITYQIVKKAASLAITDVINAPAASSASAIGVPAVAGNPSVTAIALAAAHLSDQASNVVVAMNRLTEIEFINAQAAGAFNFDPFAGLPRVYTSALKAFSAASVNETYAIVGDLRAIQFNYPEGDGIVLKYDDLSLAEDDLVKVVGRQYAAHAVTEPGRLVKMTKTA